MRTKGLVLSRQWRDRGGEQSLVFWLTTFDGPVRVEMTGQESVFFIRDSDRENVLRLLGKSPEHRFSEVKLRCFEPPHEAAIACYFRNQRDMGFARAKLEDAGIPAFEADLRPTDRFLMERFIRGTMEIQGESEQHPGYQSCLNPQVRHCRYDATPAVLSLDIETSVTTQVVLSIAVHGEGIDKVFMQGPAVDDAPDYLVFCADEKTLLLSFLEWFSDSDPDVIIGWSVVGFDLRFLQDRCDAHGISFTLGRAGETVSWRKVEQGQQRLFAVVPGRVVIDGIEMLRTATYSFESFSLENVSRELLGRGKLVHDVDARAFEIERMFAEDKLSLARYNLEDCALVLDIFRETDLIAFALQRATLTGLDIERQGGSVAAFDFLYLPRLHREGYVAPVVNQDEIRHSPGGYVLDSTPGLYRDVIVLDFKSLYPSIIRTFHVDPLAMIAPDESRIPGFLEASFSVSRHLLPKIIEELWQARDTAKKNGDAAGSQAIKIIMNSFYGVLGTPGCRFFDPRLASSITMRGHEILKETRNLIEARGYPVIYGDTDSVFVHVDDSTRDIEQAGKELADYLNDWWREYLQSSFGITSYLEIEFETHFSRFFMPTVRGSDKGSKKRYAGMVSVDGESPRLIFKGLESVRSDWTTLARSFQQELFRRVFLDEPVNDYIRDTVIRVAGGELDEQLVLRRRLRRKLGDYTRNVPPHVRAARLADSERKRQGLQPKYEYGGWIEYLMTVNGPEPQQYLKSPLDYDFYIDRQLAPIADAVLTLQGTSLAALTDKQMGLF